MSQPLNRWALVSAAVNRGSRYFPLIIPAVYLVASLWLIAKSGPHLPVLADPSAHYLTNGFEVLMGNGTGHVLHPGITLNLFIALLLSPLGLLDREMLAVYLVTQPELFLSFIALALCVALALALSYFGRVVRHAYGLLAMGVAQTVAIAMPGLWDVSGRVFPEVLMLALALLFTAQVLREARHHGQATWPSILMLAALGALGVCSKLTFLPLLVLPFFVVRGRRLLQWILLTAGSVLVLFAITGASLLKGVGWAVYGVMTSGRNPGDAGRGAMDMMSSSASVLWQAYGVQLVAAALGLVLLVMLSLSGTRAKGTATPNRLVAGLLAAVVLTVALTYKEPRSTDLLVLGPLLGALLGIAVARLPGRSAETAPLGAALLVPLTLANGVFAFLYASHALERQESDERTWTAYADEVSQLADDRGFVIFPFPGGDQGSALMWANGNFSRNGLGAQLFEAYPRTLLYKAPQDHLSTGMSEPARIVRSTATAGFDSVKCQDFQHMATQGLFVVAVSREKIQDALGTDAHLVWEEALGNPRVERIDSVQCGDSDSWP